MSITATCGACGRNFVAPEQFQGKRVKCKGCGEIFTVTNGTSPAHSTHGDLETDPLAQLASAAVSDSNPGSASSPFDRSDDDDEEASDEHGGPQAGLTPNVLTFDYPGSSDVDQWLPITMVIIGFLLLTVSGSNQDAKGLGWISFTRFLTPSLLYAAFTFPITLAMVRKAAAEQRFALPPSYVLRCFASYMPAFVLITWMQMAGEGLTIVQLLAGIFGVAVSSAILWLLFRLREEHIGTTVAYGAGGFAAGIAFTIALTLGLNKIGQLIVVSEHAQASVPVSPFGEGLGWVDPLPSVPVVVAAPKPVAPPPAPVNEAVTTFTPGSSVIGQFDPGTIPGTIDDVVNPFSTSPNVAIIRGKTSGISIESWNTETWERKSGSLQLPTRPSGNIVLSTDGDRLAYIADFPRLSVQIWSFTTNSVASSVDLDRSQGNVELVGFISSDLLLINRTTRKTPAVVPQVAADTSTGAGQTPAVVAPPAPASDDFFQELNARSRHTGQTPAEGTPPVPAETTPPVAVPVQPPVVTPKVEPASPPPSPEQPSRNQLSIVDVTTGTTVRGFTLPPLGGDFSSPGFSSDAMRYGQNFTISIPKQRLAAAVKIEGIPSLLQVDLITGKTLSIIKIAELDPNLPCDPTGLTYSNDGTTLAALFENGGSGLLVGYDTTTGKRSDYFVYPAGPLEGSQHSVFHGSAICPLDPSPFWLVYGQGIVSTKTGAHLKAADLNVPNTADQRFLDGDEVQLLSNTPAGKRLSVLKLDRAKLDTALDSLTN